MKDNSPDAWWQRGVVYQIYPRSFQDSNGDGVGDLRGIIARLDYLADLGIDAIWLSPIYPSPMADFGYDVSNYVDIDPRFGTLADFDALMAAATKRGLKVILDLVPNHTSDRHPWFVESRRDRTNPKRDWYIWRDPAPNGGPPNNWLSEFGGPAWTRDPATGQFYYHAYLAAQPDLNWRNPAVADAIHNVMRFWFDRGVAGFRIDTIHHLFEDESLHDNPPNPDFMPGDPPTEALLRQYQVDRPETHAALVDLRKVADSYDPPRLLIGEAYLPLKALMAYYGADGNGLQLPFNFHLLRTPWNAQALAEVVRDYESLLPPGAWPNWVLGNHDRARLASRIGIAQAPVAAMLLLTLRGTPTIYYGEELGLSDVAIPPQLVQDPWEKQVPGHGLGRDPVRTPMPWDDGRNAGFTMGTPWLPLNADALTRNVAAQRADAQSMLALYRRLLALRRAEPALAIGDYGDIASAGDVLSYERRVPGRRLRICLNLGGRAAPPISAPAHAEIVLSTGPGTVLAGGQLTLAPHEGAIVVV